MRFKHDMINVSYSVFLSWPSNDPWCYQLCVYLKKKHWIYLIIWKELII